MRVIELFNHLSIKPETEIMIDEYTEYATNILDSLNLKPEKRAILDSVIQKLIHRNS